MRVYGSVHDDVYRRSHVRFGVNVRRRSLVF
jgi:hypothetical protein